MKLYTKILLGVAATSLLAGQAIVVFTRKVVHEALLFRIEQAAKLEARGIESELAAAMRSGEEGPILSILHGYALGVDGASAAAIDLNGRVLAHTNVAEVGKIRDDAETVAALKSDVISSLEGRDVGRLVLSMFIPVFAREERGGEEEFLLSVSAEPQRGVRAGLLRVDLPLDTALATESQIAGRILRVVLLVCGVTGLLLYYLLRRLLTPIALLSAATEKIRGGDYRAVVPVTTNDEIGELAASFNGMSRALAETTVSRTFLNDILDSIQDQIIVTDAAGRIVLVNPAVVHLLGYSKEELLGRPGASLLEGEQASFLAHSRNAAASLIAKSQKKSAVLFSSAPIMDARGTITGYIGAAKDVTELRLLEARMRQSEKLSAVGQLAAGVAHEINNPLGVILGFAQGMARQLKEGDEHELPIMSIEREALRCKALVQNLLTFARTSHGDHATLDVNSAVEQTLALIAPQAKLNRVAVAAALAEGLPPVLGNKNQLEQVIMNLAKNAIDAMPDGGTLSLSSELREEAPRSWILLKFIDDGTGIPPDALPKIFDPFFTTKPIGQGTGLGLSLVSEIIQKHSGEVSVESRPGRTEFTVKLPVRTGRELDRRAETGVKGTISHG